MKAFIASGIVCLVIGIAIGFGTASFGGVTHDHSSHTSVPIPDSWTDAEVATFIAKSDRKIDAWAGRIVAPGEVIVHDGLEFKKSTPEMVAQRACNFCPIRNACHNTVAPTPSVRSTARPGARPNLTVNLKANDPKTVKLRQCIKKLPRFVNAEGEEPGIGPVCDEAQRNLYKNLQLVVKIPHPDKASLRRDVQDELSGFFRAAAKVPNRYGTASDPPGTDCIIVSRLRQEVEDCLKGE
jgi:hypothetical protein